MLEDVLKHGVGGYLAYDVGEVVDALAEVLGDKVTGEVHLKTGLYTMDGFKGTSESFVVTDIGDYDIALGYFGKGCGLYQ